jgi:hypothetical protein
MNKKHAPQPWRYRQFLRDVGVGTPELQRLFGEEVRNLSRVELLALKHSDFFHPATWTKEQQVVFKKMLDRAAVKAKRQGTAL